MYLPFIQLSQKDSIGDVPKLGGQVGGKLSPLGGPEPSRILGDRSIAPKPSHIPQVGQQEYDIPAAPPAQNPLAAGLFLKDGPQWGNLVQIQDTQNLVRRAIFWWLKQDSKQLWRSDLGRIENKQDSILTP